MGVGWWTHGMPDATAKSATLNETWRPEFISFFAFVLLALFRIVIKALKINTDYFDNLYMSSCFTC